MYLNEFKTQEKSLQNPESTNDKDTKIVTKKHFGVIALILTAIVAFLLGNRSRKNSETNKLQVFYLDKTTLS